MPPKASKRKAANGYKLPDHIPEGTIVTGTNKKQFRLGKSIGLGGFGEIYLVSEDISRAVGDDATLAMKIEPHENGPLFVEMNFYIRSAQPQMVEEFKKNRNLKSFGMPCLRGSGSHVHNGKCQLLSALLSLADKQLSPACFALHQLNVNKMLFYRNEISLFGDGPIRQRPPENLPKWQEIIQRQSHLQSGLESP